MSKKEHLTQQQLIEFQFKLASEKQMADIAAHLEGCEQCRQQLAQLNHKFASLELLRDEIKVPEELTAKVIRQARRPGRPEIFSINKPLWAGIAAVLLVGLFLVISQPGAEKTSQDNRDISLQQAPAVEAMNYQEVADSSLAKEGSETISESAESTLAADEQTAAGDIEEADDNIRIVATETSPGDVGLLNEIAPQASREGFAAGGIGNGFAATGAGRGSAGGGRGGFGGGMAGGRGEALSDTSAVATAPAQPAPPASSSSTTTSLSVARTPAEPQILAEAESIVAADTAARSRERLDIDEQPPFAPASAIELVVLPRRDNTQLTIYNSADLTLVRDKRSLTLKRGWNWLQFMWENTLIDPTSLSLEPTEQKDQIDIEQLVFPARLTNIGRWLIHSEVSGKVPFEITYLTSGISWRAFYMGTLSEDETSMDMKGYVRVTNNSGEDYENAQTRLVVGQVHMIDEIADLARRQYPYGSPIPMIGRDYEGVVFYEWQGEDMDYAQDESLMMKSEMEEIADSMNRLIEPKAIVKEGLSEYFLYTIEGTETIENQWSKRLLSFDVNDIKVDSLYKYDESRFGVDTIRFVKFANDPNHNLGETPIPDGDVKIYGLADQQGHLSYVGGTSIKYIPVNEEVELNLGTARLVEVEPTLMDYQTDNYMYDPNGYITGWDEIRTWKIEITNTKTIPVEIEITRDFGTSFWTLQSETPYEKYDITQARFEMTVQPAAKWEYEYTVITYHGDREDESRQ